ncbi:MAG: STAS domain-containing protein [Fibrobacteria bacterium]|nr:STAS domain-containing protein [Fibrobacteria bacterium]
MESISIGSNLNYQQTNTFVADVESIVKTKITGLTIDMHTCQYLNSLMLSGLIRAHKICKAADCSLVLSNVNSSAMTLFETTNVLGLFTIQSSEHTEDIPESLNLAFTLAEGQTGVISISGSLNNPEQCTQFRNFYEGHVLDIKHGIMDCSTLENLGSSGVTEMFRLRGILYEKGGKLIIASKKDSVESVWRMMHLESLIPKMDTIELALAHINVD